MIRLYVFCEGPTERAFVSTILAPHLCSHDVVQVAPVLISHGRKRGLTHYGGGSSYEAMKQDMLRQMRNDANSDARFTTMIDFYGLPAKFPGMAVASDMTDPYRKVAKLEECFENDIADRRFIPFITLHEYESLVLSNPPAFMRQFDSVERRVTELQEIADNAGGPENVNDGEQTAPSKRILRLFPGYDKVADGPLIAQHIGLPTIRRKCPHFNAWVEQLEQLAATSE